MAQALAGKEQYLSDFEQFGKRVASEEAPWLRALRQEAISRFASLGFPTGRRGNEEWKYTDVGPLAASPFRYPFNGHSREPSASELGRFSFGQPGWPRLLFIDGRYRPELSPSPSLPGAVRLGNLAQATLADQELTSRHLDRHADPASDGFAALSAAFIRDGAFLSLPEGVALDRPVHLLFISTGAEEGTVSYPRVLILAGKGSAATVVESYVGLGDGPYFTNAVTEVVAGEGASIEHCKLLLEGEAAFHVGRTQVYQERDSSFTSTSIAMGARLARNNLSVLLDAEGSRCTLNGLYVTAGTQHVDNHVFVDHARPRTTSRELYKGILDGRSTAVFDGKVLVRRDAQKADAHQSNKNLLLSEGAEADSKPHLEIYADDVKCAHGAAAGRPDESSLFYLRSRGLDEQRARELLAYAFASEVIDAIALAPLRSYVERLLLRNLPGLHARGAP